MGKPNGHGVNNDLPGMVMTNSLLLKMAIEIVSFPIKHGDFPVRYVSLPEGNWI